jgi:tRNA(His) guanylyltransferase
MKKDEFGDRMKHYEKKYTSAHIPIHEPLCIRIDGKGFSKFTKGFKKPFDDILSSAMVTTMLSLVKNTHASFSFTQSDEITLIYKPGEKASEYLFGGKVSKINSILASMATYYFNQSISAHTDKPAFFDCRTWSVPDPIEASNVILWRAQDARKNSISSLFRWTAGHRAMNGLDQSQMKNHLLKNHATDWNELPNNYKYGTYAKPIIVEKHLTHDELSRIPEKMKPNTQALVKRTQIQELDLGFFGDYTIEQRVEFLGY